MENNMAIYERFRNVPSEAQKTIQAGKLKGFIDINPMWRIKMLTEVFGACGEGWYLDNIQTWTENAGGEIAAFVRVDLIVKISGAWSKPITGIGGSKLSGKGVGDGINDEAFKMAYTDAISIACKNLGMAADIYFAKDRTKHDLSEDSQKGTKQAGSSSRQPNTPPQETVAVKGKEIDEETYWKLVGGMVEGVLCKSGKSMRQYYIDTYKPTETLIKIFDQNVEKVKAARSGGQ